jgi:hypothetical protein
VAQPDNLLNAAGRCNDTSQPNFSAESMRGCAAPQGDEFSMNQAYAVFIMVVWAAAWLVGLWWLGAGVRSRGGNAAFLMPLCPVFDLLAPVGWFWLRPAPKAQG